MASKPNPKLCACGCGEWTRGGRFKPGHDSKAHGHKTEEERKEAKLASARRSRAKNREADLERKRLQRERNIAAGLRANGKPRVPRQPKKKQHETARERAERLQAAQAKRRREAVLRPAVGRGQISKPGTGEKIKRSTVQCRREGCQEYVPQAAVNTDPADGYCCIACFWLEHGGSPWTGSGRWADEEAEAA